LGLVGGGKTAVGFIGVSMILSGTRNCFRLNLLICPDLLAQLAHAAIPLTQSTTTQPTTVRATSTTVPST
jgi:hypothetical protein